MSLDRWFKEKWVDVKKGHSGNWELGEVLLKAAAFERAGHQWRRLAQGLLPRALQ